MKKTNPCFVLLIWLFSLTSLTSVSFAQTGGGIGGGAGGTDLDVQCTATPNEVVWGYTVEIKGFASGGTPPYGFSFAIYCPGSFPVLVPQTPDEGNMKIINYEAKKTGDFEAKCVVSDAAMNNAEDTDTFTVLAPNSIELRDDDDDEPGDGKIEISVDVAVGEHFVTGTTTIVFSVKNNNTLVGSHAEGLAQERLASDNGGNPGVWGDWLPEDANDPNVQFWFDSPYIYDVKSFTATRANWETFVNGANIDVTFQEIRLNYPNCKNENQILSGGLYKVTRTKVSATKIKIKIEKQ